MTSKYHVYCLGRQKLKGVSVSMVLYRVLPRSLQVTLTLTLTLGQAESTSVATIITPADDYHAVLPPDVIGLRLPPGTKEFVFEGQLITILSVSPTALTYVIEDSGL